MNELPKPTREPETHYVIRRRPTKEGWYWFRGDYVTQDGMTIVVSRWQLCASYDTARPMVQFDTRYVYLNKCSGYWCGPIPEPQEPEE